MQSKGKLQRNDYSGLTLSQKGLVLVALPLLFQLAFIGVLSALLSQSEKQVQKSANARAILLKSASINKLLIEAGGALSGYRINKTDA